MAKAPSTMRATPALLLLLALLPAVCTARSACLRSRCLALVPCCRARKRHLHATMPGHVSFFTLRLCVARRPAPRQQCRCTGLRTLPCGNRIPAEPGARSKNSGRRLG